MSVDAGPPHRIDLHAHFLAPAYKEALQTAEMWLIGGIPVPDWTPELALEFMDAHGFAVQMLSVSDPGVEFVDTDSAPALARDCNDYVARVIADHPTRFGAFAVMSMSDVEGARAEAARCLDELGLAGVATSRATAAAIWATRTSSRCSPSSTLAEPGRWCTRRHSQMS